MSADAGAGQARPVVASAPWTAGCSAIARPGLVQQARRDPHAQVGPEQWRPGRNGGMAVPRPSVNCGYPGPHADSTYVSKFQLRQLTDVSIRRLRQHLSCNRQRAARLPARAFPQGQPRRAAALCAAALMNSRGSESPRGASGGQHALRVMQSVLNQLAFRNGRETASAPRPGNHHGVLDMTWRGVVSCRGTAGCRCPEHGLGSGAATVERYI